MQRKPRLFTALSLMVLGTAACTAERGDAGELSLVRTKAQFASQDCPNGGHTLEAGNDKNDNAQLDDDEVTSSRPICDGAQGSAGESKLGNAGKDGASGALTAVVVSAEPAGDVCANGGQRVDLGKDVNADGKIDPGVQVETVYVCNGETGAGGASAPLVSVKTSVEPPSAHCANGGTRYDYGLDSNADGTLQDAEINGTRYLCDGNVGDISLFAMSIEPAGAHCESGGKRYDYGRDENHNGVLDASEVVGATYSCNGSDGANAHQSLVDVATEPSGSNCANGGQKITSGVDDNGNGQLNSAEIDNTRYVCNGKNGAQALLVLVKVDAEPPGGNCTGGGHALKVGLDDNDNGALDAGEVDSTSYVCDFDSFQNPSFELPGYQGWTVSSSSSGQWLLATTGTTLHTGDSVFDWADKRNETLTSPGLPYTFTATNGATLAVQQQSAPGIHRICQDFTVPVHATSLTWDMYYKNTWSTWSANSQYIAINIRKPSDDSVIATLYKTGAAAPLVLSGMTPFSADLTAFAGQDIRFDIETNIQVSWIDVALDNFAIH